MLEMAQANRTLLDYFYGGGSRVAGSDKVREHFYFRTSGCDKGVYRGGTSESFDVVHGRRRNSTEKLCLWGNMPPMKPLAIIALARALNVTHIVESGRMGGMSSLVYDVHGFRTTSVEMLPLPGVMFDLRKAAPGVELLSGDGSVVVPKFLDQLELESGSSGARVAVVVDGPKEDPAYEMAMIAVSRPSVAFVAVDDSQNIRGRFESNADIAVFNTDDALWRQSFPMAADRLTANGLPMIANYFAETDNLSILMFKAGVTCAAG